MTSLTAATPPGQHRARHVLHRPGHTPRSGAERRVASLVAGYSPRRGPAPGTKIIVPDAGGRQVPPGLASAGGLPATGWVAAPPRCVTVLATVAFAELTVAVDALADGRLA